MPWSRRFRLLLLLLLVVFGACARPTPPTHFYFLDLPTPAPAAERAGEPLAARLAISELRPVARLAEPALAYVPRPLEIGYYGYHRWVDDPARLVTERLRREFEVSGLFAAISADAGSAPVGLLLEGELFAFHEEDGADGYYGVAGIEVRLVTPGEGREIWRSRYRCREAAEEQTPAAVVHALDRCMGRIAAQCVSEVYQALRSRGGP